MTVDLANYDRSSYEPGRGGVIRALWYAANVLILRNPFVIGSGVKASVLRCFGARIGRGVVIKPGVNVKFPWHLAVGDHSWIGEGVWIDNLAPTRIGSHVCISQGAYLCTGSHDWSDPRFSLIVKPIVIEDGVWVCARATILPGVTLARESVITAGAVVCTDTEPATIYRGNPAQRYKARRYADKQKMHSES